MRLRVIYPTLRPLMRVLHSRIDRRMRELPHPADSTHIHVAGVDPDRLLLFGSGPAVGYGAVSNEFALPGNLARQLSELTGRGVELDVAADPDLSIERAVDSLRTLKLWRYDAILLTVGVNDALQLTPVRTWVKALGEVLLYISEHVPHRTRVLVVAVPPIATPDSITRLSGWVADHHAVRLNRETRRIVSHRPHFTFVPFSPLATADDIRNHSDMTYEQWARLIVTPLRQQLAEERRGDGRTEDRNDP